MVLQPGSWIGQTTRSSRYFLLCISIPGDAEAAVWALDPWWLNRKLHKGVVGPMEVGWKEAEPYLRNLEASFESDRQASRGPAAIEPLHVDRRLAAQRSRFLIFGKAKDLTKTKAAREPDKTCGLTKITIPINAIGGMRSDIESAGLTISTIFPDLSGLCEELCDSWVRRSR